MIDRFVIPLQERALAGLARHLVARGVTADQITLAGFATGLLSVPLLASGLFLPALAAILTNRLADGLDGIVARMTQPTDRGAFADIAFDFAFYAAVPLGFALADPSRNALPATVLIAAFVATGSSFLAFAVVAAGRGLRAADYPAKGIYYLGGLTEGTETVLFFAAACLLPESFPVLAYIFAGLCAITAATRWHQGWTAFAGLRPRS
jgi:phosphatidylglycerophosphate synthase